MPVKKTKPAANASRATNDKKPALAAAKPAAIAAAKPAAKPVVKSAVKPATKPEAKPSKPAKAETTPMTRSNELDKAEPILFAHEKTGKKAKKAKVIRDSFTMPEADYSKLAEIKKKCLANGVSVKKSELLRAGLHLLEALPLAKLKIAVGALDSVKTGRPPMNKAE